MQAVSINLDPPLQGALLDMLRILLATEQAKIIAERPKEKGAKELLHVLRDSLHLDGDDLLRTMRDLSHLDISMREADSHSLQALQVPSLSILTEPLPITTYASLLWRTLMQVSLAVSVKHIPSHSSMGASPRVAGTPRLGATPRNVLNVTPRLSVSVTPRLSGSATPRVSGTPAGSGSPKHLGSSAVEAACHVCKEVIVCGLILAPPK